MAVSWFFMEIRHLLRRIKIFLSHRHQKWVLWKTRKSWPIRMDLQEVGCGYMDWIGLSQDKDSWRTLVSVLMNLRIPWNAGNFLASCKPVSFSRRTLHHGVSKYYAPNILLPHSCVTGQNAEWFWKWRWRKVSASFPVPSLAEYQWRNSRTRAKTASFWCV